MYISLIRLLVLLAYSSHYFQLSLSSYPPWEHQGGGYYPLYPPEYATGWKGGREGREGGGVVGRPHFEGASLSSRVFFKAFKNSTKCLGSGSGIRVLKPDPDSDPEKFKNRIRIQAKSPDPTGSGSATPAYRSTCLLVKPKPIKLQKIFN